ncbi:MAG: AAA family ATPase, partial [Chloroflexota bacterium]
MLHPFIHTKLNVPPLRRGVLERDALIQKLNRGVDGRLLLATAPAGYGKTTLITQWLAQQDRPVAWITLDENDSTPDLFFNLLMSAVDKATPDFDGIPFPAQGDSDLMQAALYGLINSLAGTEQSAVIVLDDYHVITHPDIHAGFDLLIDHLPPQILIAVTSRERPPLSLPRWRARGWVTEITQHDLKFDVEQSGRFFRETMDIPVTDEVVKLVNERVDGWVTGLQFTGLRLQNNPVDDGLNLERVDSFSADYLLAEVLEKEPAETQQFLVRTSILGRLCGPLCNAILQIDSAQQQLEAMEARSLFTLPLDDHREWFRYHPLMADLLQAKLLREFSEEEVAQLHRDAAAWFYDNGWLEESISHALAADDHHLAARYLSSIKSSYLWEENGATNLARWLEQLPDHFVVEYPHIGVMAIGANLLRGQLGNTLHMLAQLEGKEEIEGYWWALHGNIKRNAGLVDEALADLEKAIELLDYDDPTSTPRSLLSPRAGLKCV